MGLPEHQKQSGSYDTTCYMETLCQQHAYQITPPQTLLQTREIMAAMHMVIPLSCSWHEQGMSVWQSVHVAQRRTRALFKYVPRLLAVEPDKQIYYA